MKIFKNLNESTLLLEYNRKDLRKWAGDDLTNRYMAIRNKLQAPENDLGYWIKKDDLSEFTDFVTGWETGNIKSKTQAKKEERIAGADLILNNKGWKVYFVKTYDAAKQLGSGTTWCITGRYRRAESRGKYYFDSYIRDYNLNGGYYFIFDTTRKDPSTNDYEKYCAGVDKSNRLVFLYNGMQDSNITRRGIPLDDIDREIDLIPGVKIPFNTLFKIKNNILVGVDEDISGTVSIPDGVTGIKHRCFLDLRNIREVIIPESITEIGTGAFMKSGVSSINLKNVEKLGRGVFFNCNRLVAINMGTSLTEIPHNTFGYCEHLNYVTIEDQVKTIEDDAFDFTDYDNLVFYTDNPVAIEYAEKHGIQHRSKVKINL